MIAKIKPPRKKRKATLFVRGLSAHLKAQFKAYCAEREQTMRQTIVEFMIHCVKDDKISFNRQRS